MSRQTVTVTRRAIGQWGIQCPFCGRPEYFPSLGDHRSKCDRGDLKIQDTPSFVGESFETLKKRRFT